jgi:formylmethanofuran dehydrogenase subunit E
MGKEKKTIKDRKCSKCEQTFATDAEGIKNHARVCGND